MKKNIGIFVCMLSMCLILFASACTTIYPESILDEHLSDSDTSIALQQIDDEENAIENIENDLEQDISPELSNPNGYDEEKQVDDIDGSILEVHFIDVGQGDCALVTCDGEAMLIDAGNNDKGTTVQLYLKKQGVEKIKYIVGTHPDSDHIGGMDVIIYKYDCETIIMPNKSSDTHSYSEVIDTIDYKNYSITYPNVGDEYYLGKAKFVIVGPEKSYQDDNNCSVAIKLIHGDNSFVFTGDAKEEAELDYIKTGINLEAAVLKLGHHGSSSSSCKEFLNAVSPQYAVICCGKDNDYGHPHVETLDRVKELGCKVFRTDEQGNIVVTSDGKNLTWNCRPSDTWQAGKQISDQQSESKEVESSEIIPVETKPSTTTSVKYILNTNTKKFHYPTCSSVGDMKEKNKRESSDSRDTIISEGYVPCKRCNP